MESEKAKKKRLELAIALEARQIQNIANKLTAGKTLTGQENRRLNKFIDDNAEEEPGKIERFLSGEDVARHYGVKSATVWSHVKKGNIHKNDDGSFDKPVCDAFWVEKLGRPLKKMTGKDVEKNGDEPDPSILKKIEVQKLRKMRAEADVKETMAEQMKGNLVPRDMVVRGWGERYRMFRDSLLNLTDRLPPLLVNREQNEIEQVLQNEVYSILMGFAKDGKYTPKSACE